jgi:hypothetical protein
MIVALLATSALAASPGGFRLGPGVAASSLSVREVVIADPPSPYLLATAVRAQIAAGAWVLSADLPVVATWEPGWRDVGAGQLRLGVRRVTGREDNPITALAELAIPSVPRPWRTSSWGSHARETLPGVEAMIGVEAAGNPDAPWVVHAAVGVRRGPYLDEVDGLSWLGELGAAGVRPIVGPLSLVVEGELLTDLTPMAARALARVDAGAPVHRLSVDAGVQVPVLAWFDGQRAVQPIAQVRGWW